VGDLPPHRIRVQDTTTGVEARGRLIDIISAAMWHRHELAALRVPSIIANGDPPGAKV
jgi:hypothetical protein